MEAPAVFDDRTPVGCDWGQVGDELVRDPAVDDPTAIGRRDRARPADVGSRRERGERGLLPFGLRDVGDRFDHGVAEAHDAGHAAWKLDPVAGDTECLDRLIHHRESASYVTPIVSQHARIPGPTSRLDTRRRALSRRSAF